MGFKLKLREPLPDGLKRVFREQIESALELCRHPARERGVTVHEVRKHLKKLRAAMRLAIPEVGKNRHTREDRCVRKIGRLVSDLRDAQVRLQTLIQLRDEAAKGSEDSPFHALKNYCRWNGKVSRLHLPAGNNKPSRSWNAWKRV